MQPGYPYNFNRSIGFMLLYVLLFVVTSMLAFLEFMLGRNIWAVLFSIIALLDLCVGIFLYMKPFAVLTEHELTFHLSPVIRKTVTLRDIIDMAESGNKITLLLSSGKKVKVNTLGVETVARNNLVRFLQGVVQINRGSAPPIPQTF